ncbi:MAG: M23 family metallopeptidase [Firmicutes bacterium]|nr:M23 family metallopeptidase [Bacillota bacterium]
MRDFFTMSRQQFWIATIVSGCLILIALFYGLITWNEAGSGEGTGNTATDMASGQELQADADPKTSEEEGLRAETANGMPSEDSSETAGNDVVSSSANYMLPVKGEVFRTHSMTELTYFPTLNQYMAHRGIDILAPAGTEVCAAAEGLVSKVMDDKAMGKTVWIAHAGEIITVYSNLNEDIAVEEGDTVTKGQVIGTAGNTSLFEKSDEPHIHVEVLVKGEPVDPSGYFSY